MAVREREVPKVLIDALFRPSSLPLATRKERRETTHIALPRPIAIQPPTEISFHFLLFGLIQF